MNKQYDHHKHEAKIYSLWEKTGSFTPKVTKHKTPYTVIMPPPNANDPLHIGHARFIAIEDILTRYHRMLGKPTLWLPGADHAGIETQYVFEKRLAEKGKSRTDYDQETLYKMIWDYVMDNKGTMEKQLRQLGSSCDWTRNKFTLSPDIIKIVYSTFKKLYDDGMVYRGERIVNYCPLCGTTFSQLEVNHIEREDDFYYLDYGCLSIATTRPETIFADVAVAVNPKDKKYKNLVGKKAQLPIVNRELPIIADSLVDPEFGTGALKVTPAHDATDFEIGTRHNLPTISVIDKDGLMVNTPQKYIGSPSEKAKEQVVKDLINTGKLIKKEKILHTVGTCYKHKSLIEPIISKQWFLKVDSLSKNALNAIQKGNVKFTAKKFEKIAKHWLRNLKDWNISRQITWGIRIPAWRCNKCLEWTITSGKTPKKCPSCGNAVLIQDKDTFDTWFSSGQWPFATLKTTKPGDFNYFYPTSLMETGYDIIPFWVIRMIMLGLYTTGDVPFKEVLIHGLVRDKNREKISKSKGNVIDPIEMVKKYGADALRMGIIWGTLVENDIALSEDNIRAQRNFSNKIWNITRFVLQNKTSNKNQLIKKPRAKNDNDKWILNELKSTTRKVTKKLDKHRLSEASEEIYSFVWNKFASNYLEKSKNHREQSQPVLEYVLLQSLKLLHPFMPFITELIYQQGFSINKKDLLISANWPK